MKLLKLPTHRKLHENIYKMRTCQQVYIPIHVDIGLPPSHEIVTNLDYIKLKVFSSQEGPAFRKPVRESLKRKLT